MHRKNACGPKNQQHTKGDLSFAKMLTSRRINNMRLSFPEQSVMTPRHVQPVFALVRDSFSALSAPGKSGLGERRSSSTAGGAEATPSSGQTQRLRQALLGRGLSILVAMETILTNESADCIVVTIALPRIDRPQCILIYTRAGHGASPGLPCRERESRRPSRG